MLRDENFEDKRTEEEKQASQKRKELLYKRDLKRWRPTYILLAIQSAIIFLFPENWFSIPFIAVFSDFMAFCFPVIELYANGSLDPDMTRVAYAFTFLS